MRVIKNHSHPEFNITVFAWNGKYILKFEQSLLEQTYKIPETDFSGDADVQKLLDNAVFLANVTKQFTQMRNTLADAFESI